MRRAHGPPSEPGYAHRYVGVVARPVAERPKQGLAVLVDEGLAGLEVGEPAGQTQRLAANSHPDL